MKVTVRGDRLTIDVPSMGLLIAALDTAANSWLDLASGDSTVRKQMLTMAGQAKALSILLVDKRDEQPEETVI